MILDPEDTSLKFGLIEILPHRREVKLDDRIIKFGGRSFDILMILTEAQGCIVSKDELLNRVWPGRVVEEGVLPVQISAIRKALAPRHDLIRTVSGLGYQLIGTDQSLELAVTPASLEFSALTNIPAQISELIGREINLGEIAGLVMAHRLVTLIGVGGIGKTRLGIEVARSVRQEFDGGVWLVELAHISDPRLVPYAVAAALGLTLSSNAVSAAEVASVLGTRNYLLVVDNCEHLVDAVALMCEALLTANSLTRILATSREPLRVQGEITYRVPPLDVPGPEVDDLKSILAHGAVKLLVIRAMAAERMFSADIKVAQVAATICKRLDGIPLAIELATARISSLGIVEVAKRLEQRFDVLVGGHRTALPRHQTMRATLDWSFNLLSISDKIILRRLAVFAGSFDLRSASAVIADGEIGADDVVDGITSLTDKSMLSVKVVDDQIQYRLLETQRAYAREKLDESGEGGTIRRGLAELCLSWYATESDWWAAPATPMDLATHRQRIDDVRSSLDWCFSSEGSAATGVNLIATTGELFYELSLINEYRWRLEQALDVQKTMRESNADLEFMLYVALGNAKAHTMGLVSGELEPVDIARKLPGQVDDLLIHPRALWGAWLENVTVGNYGRCVEISEHFKSICLRHEHMRSAFADRMLVCSHHFLGNLTLSREIAERSILQSMESDLGGRSDAFQFCQPLCDLAQVLWIQGFPEQACIAAKENFNQQIGMNAISLSHAFAGYCSVALWCGDRALARDLSEQFLACTKQYSLDYWAFWARCVEVIVKLRDRKMPLQIARQLLDEPFCNALLSEFLCTFHGTLITSSVISRAESHGAGWCAPEILRIKGENLLSEGGCSSEECAAAEILFLRSLEMARQQGALSWELRGATSLARLYQLRGRTIEAHNILASVYARFTEGFGTADLITAKELLGSLA